MKVSPLNPIQQNNSLQTPSLEQSAPATIEAPQPTQSNSEALVNAVASLQAESIDPAFTAPEVAETPNFSPASLDSLSQEVFQGLQAPEVELPTLTQPELPPEPGTPIAFNFNTTEPLEIPESQVEAPEQSTIAPEENRAPETLNASTEQPTTISDLDSDAQEMVLNLQQNTSVFGL